jgi:hypothetical protein
MIRIVELRPDDMNTPAPWLTAERPAPVPFVGALACWANAADANRKDERNRLTVSFMWRLPFEVRAVPPLFATGGVTDDRIHASTDVRPIARCLRYGRPAPINSDANPATKRPNAIHLGCMVNLVGSPPNPRDVRLRHVMSGCNRVVSQCEMAGASVTIPHRHRPNNAPTAGTFRVGRREARSLSERWPADPLLAPHRLQFKAIDAR